MTATRHSDPPAATGRRRSWSFLASPGWIAVIVVAIAFAAVSFFVLAPWQFGRNDERSAQNALIEAATQAPAVPATDVFSTTDPPAADLTWRLVTATGTFEPDAQVVVRLRQDEDGNPVSEVVLPLRLADGTRLLVDRGYVSLGVLQSGAAIPEVPVGTVAVTGRLQPEQSDPLGRAPVAVGGRTEVYAINRAAVAGAAAASGPAVGRADTGSADTGTYRIGYIQLIADSPGVLNPIGLPRTEAGPFLSYALQWCAFGLIALVGLAIFVRRELGDSRPPDDHVDAPGMDPPRTGPTGNVSAAVDTSAMEADPVATPSPAPPPSKRRRGFDRSQLYD